MDNIVFMPGFVDLGTEERQQLLQSYSSSLVVAESLSNEEKKKALASCIFLKEKQNGDIKARSCANRSVQQDHVAKEEAASPNVAFESVIVTSTINARESREVVAIDIPGVFLHATNEDYVIM
jgi:hypothetical protein